MRPRSVLLALILVFVLGHLSALFWRSSPLPEAADTDHGSAQPVADVSGPSPGLLATASASPAGFDHLTSREERNIGIFRDASPSVAYISNFDLRRDRFSFNVFEIPQGSGSGFVWDKKGHVVTNYHVIKGARKLLVVLSDQSEWDAELVGVAINKDLAVLKIDAPASQLKPISVGSSSNLMVGQEVMAIGNPFGLDYSLTVGVVSALGRELTSPGGLPIRDVIQIDAAINPGNSGGPLLDSSGRLIGVNTAIYSPSGASAGIGFSVPVDTVSGMVPQLIEHGEPVRAGIGVVLVSDHVARRSRIEGVVIREVSPGGPADRAGIEGIRRTRRGSLVAGDVIVAVDGQKIASRQDLVLAFEEAGVGTRVRITLKRDREERDVEIELISLISD